MTIELNSITSGYSTGLINDNFQSLEAYINNKLLNRDGLGVGETNQMEVGLDMNSNYVYNLPEPVLEHQAARLQDVQNAISGDTNQANLIIFTPYGNIAAENVQGAIQELADNRTIYVGSVAELEALSLPVGANVYLSEESRCGDGVIRSGSHPSDPQRGVFIDLTNDNYWERSASHLTPQMFGATGDGITNDSDAVEAWLNFPERNKNGIASSSYLLSNPINPSEFNADFCGATVIIDHELVDSDACLNLPNRHILKNINITSSDSTIDRDAVFTETDSDDDASWHNVSFDGIGGRACNSTASNHKITGILSMKNCQQSPDFDDSNNDPARPRGALRFSGENLTIDTVILSGGKSRGLALSSCNNVKIKTVFSDGYNAENQGEFFYVNNCTDIDVETIICKELTSAQGCQLFRISRLTDNVRVGSIKAKCLDQASGVRIFGGANIDIEYDIYVENARSVYVTDHPKNEPEDDWPTKNVYLKGKIVSDGAQRVVEVGILDNQEVDNINISGLVKANGGRESAFRPAAVNLVNAGYRSFAKDLIVDLSEETASSEGNNEGIHCRSICVLRDVETIGANNHSLHAREGTLHIYGAKLDNDSSNGINSNSACDLIWARGVVANGLLNMSNAADSVLSFSESRGGNNAVTEFQNWSG